MKYLLEVAVAYIQEALWRGHLQLESAYKIRTCITELRECLCGLLCLRKCMTGHRATLNGDRNIWLQNSGIQIQQLGGRSAMDQAVSVKKE